MELSTHMTFKNGGCFVPPVYTEAQQTKIGCIYCVLHDRTLEIITEYHSIEKNVPSVCVSVGETNLHSYGG